METATTSVVDQGLIEAAFLYGCFDGNDTAAVVKTVEVAMLLSSVPDDGASWQQEERRNRTAGRRKSAVDRRKIRVQSVAVGKKSSIDAVLFATMYQSY